MAFKEFELDDIGNVTVYKRRTSRVIRLTVAQNGTVKVTIPTWTPYAAGVGFAKSRAAWILQHKPTRTKHIQEGQGIGKSHRMVFVPDKHVKQPATHVRGTEIRIRYPAAAHISDPPVQTAAEAAALRALRLQSTRLLKIRLDELAQAHGYTYKSMSVKKLTGRWGSCDQDKNIIFNIYLIQLPWHLIDYVIMHELAHTRVLSHGAPFWKEMEQYTPNAKNLRKQVHEYQPTLLHKT